MSRFVLHELLRGELGFSGVIVSDALDMVGASGSLGMAGAAVAALRAGCDLLCLGTENTDAQLDDIEHAVNDAVADSALTSTRLSEAIGRVRRLAEDLKAAREAASQPPAFEASWPEDEAELIHTLDVQPGVSKWRGRAAGHYTVVRLEADPNIAVGTTPWGPFAALHLEPFDKLKAHSAFAAQPDFLITPERSTLPPLQRDAPVLVIGRDIHRHPFAREVIGRLRSQHADVLVVDMGWPSADRRYADVATFGASRLMGDVLLNWLGEERDAAE